MKQPPERPPKQPPKSPPGETELKFSLPPGRAAGVLKQVPTLAAAAPRTLTSVYFDTDRRTLKRAGLTLRVRAEPEGFIQTLKQADDSALARGEWAAPLDGPAPQPQHLHGTPAAAALRKGAQLAQQFTVISQRRSCDVREGDSLIEISLDEAEVRAEGKAAQPFTELELELKAGPVWGVLALARKLAQGEDLTLSFTSKAERGFAVVAPPKLRARKFEAPRLRPGQAAGEAFRATAEASLRQIVGNAEALRQRPSPEVIHQLRVGLRRLRSLITTFKALVADARLPALKAELEWLTGELDGARNLDVLLHGGYRAALADKLHADGLKGLGTRLRDARRMAYARAATAVEGERCRRLLLDLLIWIEAGPWTGEAARAAARDEPIARFARKALDRRRRKIVARGRHVADLDAGTRHKLRIDAKKLRYAADVFAPLFDRPKRTRAFLAALKAVQDQLGELNDIVVGETLARDVAASAGMAAGDAAFAAGRITGARAAEADHLLATAQAALDALADAKPFWPA